MDTHVWVSIGGIQSPAELIWNPLQRGIAIPPESGGLTQSARWKLLHCPCITSPCAPLFSNRLLSSPVNATPVFERSLPPPLPATPFDSKLPPVASSAAVHLLRPATLKPFQQNPNPPPFTYSIAGCRSCSSPSSSCILV